MLLRKINAIITLLATALLINHAIYASGWMLFNRAIIESPHIIPWMLVGLLATHAFISIYLVAATYMEEGKSKVKSYPKMNKTTVFQRASGVLLIIFIALHVAEASDAITPPHIIHLIMPQIFFIMALAHTCVSVDKAFITLGIGNVGFVKAIKVIVRVVCAVTLVASVVGYYLYAW